MSDEAIWNKYRDELTRYASMMVGPADAEDVLSSVVLRVLARRGLADLNDPRSYLYKSVTNEARSVIRRRQRNPMLTTKDVLPSDVEPEVLTAVLRLPPQQKAAVYLAYWRDLPLSEIADLMGCSPGSVKRYLHIARKRLSEVLSDE